MVIRDAVVQDAATLAALVESAYRGDASRAGWTTEADLLVGNRTDPGEVAGQITGDGTLMLVAENADDGIVGCCHLSRRDAATAYFGMFAVRPVRQGGGVGRALLDAAEARAVSEWGSGELVMWVLSPRADLIAWYARRGYRPTGHLEAFPAERDDRMLVPGLTFTELAKPLRRP